MTDKPDVFISHASPDKDAFVRPLTEALRRLGVAVSAYVSQNGMSERQVVIGGKFRGRRGLRFRPGGRRAFGVLVNKEVLKRGGDLDCKVAIGRTVTDQRIAASAGRRRVLSCPRIEKL